MQADLIIRNGTLIDGTGAEAFNGDLAVSNGVIEIVGDASEFGSETIWDATGKVVCPGFIDIHSHSDFTLLANRNAESGIRQGITTVVTGNCGHGPAPAHDCALAKGNTLGFNEGWGVDFSWHSFDEYLATLFTPGVAINTAPLVPHGTVRLAIMGYADRPATKREIADMQALVDDAMSAGAAGFSTGLEYSPGQYATRDELIALSEPAAKRGGFYASHIRNRGDTFVEAVEEALGIARDAGLPAQLSHLAPRPYADPGAFDQVLERIYDARDREGMRIGIDTFPDRWGPGPVVTLLPPWVYEGPHGDVLARLNAGDTADRCRPYVSSPDNYLLRLGGFECFYLTCSKAHPEMVGKSFADIAAHFGLDYTDTIMKLVLDDEEDFYNVMLRHIYADAADLDRLLAQPICSLESDGAVAAPYGVLENFVMNRSSYCYTVRFLGEYVTDRGLFTLEEGIRKMTSLPADSAGLGDRGRLRAGHAADIVVFDPGSMTDNSTDSNPRAHPDGIELVLVNGEVVLADGRHTGALPGRRLPA
jgi:N-acyl-D-aspartate/D-glutamate deacylase